MVTVYKQQVVEVMGVAVSGWLMCLWFLWLNVQLRKYKQGLLKQIGNHCIIYS